MRLNDFHYTMLPYAVFSFVFLFFVRRLCEFAPIFVCLMALGPGKYFYKFFCKFGWRVFFGRKASRRTHSDARHRHSYK